MNTEDSITAAPAFPLSDHSYMRRALRLAALGRHASPNPMVGCVIAAPGGQIVGEGWHPQAGLPHAEVYALRAAGNLARGATAYVTLEPCAHHGRTPPCADALLQAGIAHVVAAMPDPDRQVAGQGLERLRAGGIQVTVGVGESEARALNAAFLKHRTTGLPWVVLKSAMTLDGKIATAEGDSRWISSSLSRLAVHRQLRDRCDAILTGVGTVLADDPSFTTRLKHRHGRNPLRVVVDSYGRTPLDSLFVQQSSEDGKSIIALTEAAPSSRTAEYQGSGCQVLLCKRDGTGRVDLSDLFHRLGTRNDVIGVLAECGGELGAALLQTGLADRWVQFIGPKIVGGRQSPGPIGGNGIAKMADAISPSSWKTRRCGPDLVIDMRFG